MIQTMEERRTVQQLFHDGHYTEAINELEERLKQCTNGLDKTLLLQNDVTICRMMLADSMEKKSSLMPALEGILQTCSSVPVKEDILHTELVTLYNYLYTSLTWGKTTQAAGTSHGSQYQTANRTFYRLCRLLAVDGVDVQHLTSLSPRDCCYHLIDRCLSSLVYRYGPLQRITVVFCHCVNMVCVTSVRDKHDVGSMLEKVQHVLDTMEKTGATVETSETGEGLMLPVQADNRDTVVTVQTVRDMAVYLQAVEGFRLGRWTDCHQCLQRIQSPEYKIVASFLSGWALYKNSQGLESVALLMETLRSQRPLTQRLKARIYSLIGMCFGKLDKVQLAIQMYKEALSADFGFLLPLYKVSEQYRRQGNSDMELECLNLLVTAIEMREPAVQSVVSGLDLLDLVDLEDSDIPYPRALLMMASRALALHKYEAASEKYTQLISHLQSWQSDAQAFKCIPSLDQVYMESVQALLKSQRFAECVSMCDTVMTANCCQGDVSNTSLMNNSSIFRVTGDTSSLTQNSSHDDFLSRILLGEDSKTSVKKRKCSDSQGLKEEACSRQVQTEVAILKVKAEALVKLGDETAALSCLERAGDLISRQRRALLQDHHMLTNDQPVTKRRKLDPDRSVHEETSAMDTFQTEGEIYTLTAEILTSQNQRREAQHYVQLAAQLRAVSSRLHPLNAECLLD